MSTGNSVALDLGTRTGWAVGNARPFTPGRVVSGVQLFASSRFDGGGMRFLRFRRWLDEVLAGAGVVYFEEVRRHVGTDAAHIYGGLLAVLTAFCEEHGIPYQGVPVGTIKRHATGKGNADKAAMLAAIRAKGYTPDDDNEADAIALLLAMESEGVSA
jgi:Holliday junction resolvasome RuvABC endonuclease subunit